MSIQASSIDTQSGSIVTVVETYGTAFVFTQSSESIKFNCIQCIAFIFSPSFFDFFFHVFAWYVFCCCAYQFPFVIVNKLPKRSVASCSYWIVSVMAQDRLLEMLHFYLAKNMKGSLSHNSSHQIWNAHSILQIQSLVRRERERAHVKSELNYSKSWCWSICGLCSVYVESDEHMKIMSIVCIFWVSEFYNKFTLILVIGVFFAVSFLYFGF